MMTLKSRSVAKRPPKRLVSKSRRPKRQSAKAPQSKRPTHQSQRPKPQRIRDPLHNLIQFGTEQFEDVIWRVIQTRPFQRLRRIKQLGFSELVYPGATHTRFAHSIGVFHTARHLMEIIKRHLLESRHQPKDHQERVALAAALVHDLGHGMFSHAFEDVGKRLQLKMAEHTHVSDLLIRESEVGEIFKKEMGSGFANDVADVIKRDRPGNLYDAVVSSQFDADRLDYMQRDRLMTGLQNSGIDFTWLVANLEIGRIPTGVDEQSVGEIETFVLGPKAFHAAETYILALFQLYPTVYFHKTTRAAEKLFTVLMLRIVSLVRDGQAKKIGLPTNHPILQFAKNPEALDNALALDDAVFWGALPMLGEARDQQIATCAQRLRDRTLPKCIDVFHRLTDAIGPERSTDPRERKARRKRLERSVASIEERLQIWSEKKSDGVARIMTDRAVCDPYKRFQESKGPLNQIHIRVGTGISDVAECSPVIAAIEQFELFRAYVDSDDTDARDAVANIIDEELRRNRNG